LITLKNDRLRDKERKKDVESLLGGLSDERFAILVNLGKKITDWSANQSDKSKTDDGEDIDENIGVKVMIGDEEDEEDEDNDVSEIVDEQDDEDEEGQDAGEHQIIQGNVI
jgi:pre-mRNA-splicing helicase BRR2